MRNRIKEIRGYMRHLPGSIGIVIYNRKNGAIWHNANAGVSYPAASTMKLAMMTDILQRSDAGSINLTSADRQAMFEALYTSSPTAQQLKAVLHGRCGSRSASSGTVGPKP